MGGQVDRTALLAAAVEAASHAYCPYSGYPVGAAILDERGALHAGCNVESVAFTPGLCAERVAVGKMASTGARRIVALAVATRDGVWPCGVCRQLLNEFVEGSSPTPVFAVDKAGNVRELDWSELFPHAFRSSMVRHED